MIKVYADEVVWRPTHCKKVLSRVVIIFSVRVVSIVPLQLSVNKRRLCVNIASLFPLSPERFLLMPLDRLSDVTVASGHWQIRGEASVHIFCSPSLSIIKGLSSLASWKPAKERQWCALTFDDATVYYYTIMMPLFFPVLLVPYLWRVEFIYLAARFSAFRRCLLESHEEVAFRA
jgi:hypothetical protein